MKKTFFIVIPLILFAFTAFGQNLNIAKLDSFLNTLSRKGLAMGSLTISKNGKIEYQKAIGYSSLSSDKKVDANINTKYRIGSSTKMFTAVMIFQLVEEGQINLDQPLKMYFPDLPNAGKITIQHMLSHRSGLHDYTHNTNFSDWMGSPQPQEELLRIIREKGSDFEPGTTADYSNSNYLLLGYIVEKVCKIPYGVALKKRITSKLNLKATYLGKPVNLNNNESYSYKYADSNWTIQKETDLSIHGGAGSIVSTPTEMVKFIDALFSHKLVSKTSLTKMKTMNDAYGLGMFSNKYGDRPSFGHNGRIEEFYSALWYFPNEKISLAYCTNGIVYPRSDIIEGVLKICFNDPFSIPFIDNSNYQSEDLDKYPGKYSSGQIVVNCTKDGTRLFLETRGKVFEVKRISNNYFMHSASGYFFQFSPDQGELQIKETDNVYHLKRSN